jgi:hypothetical protein
VGASRVIDDAVQLTAEVGAQPRLGEQSRPVREPGARGQHPLAGENPVKPVPAQPSREAIADARPFASNVVSGRCDPRTPGRRQLSQSKLRAVPSARASGSAREPIASRCGVQVRDVLAGHQVVQLAVHLVPPVRSV